MTMSTQDMSTQDQITQDQITQDQITQAQITQAQNNQEHDRLDRLKLLSPLQAIQAWLRDDCGYGERTYLVTAIQRDRRIELDDDEIAYVIDDAMQSSIDAPAVFDRLLTAGDGFQACNVKRLPAR
jgi:hypothetical protein